MFCCRVFRYLFSYTYPCKSRSKHATEYLGKEVTNRQRNWQCSRYCAAKCNGGVKMTPAVKSHVKKINALMIYQHIHDSNILWTIHSNLMLLSYCSGYWTKSLVKSTIYKCSNSSYVYLTNYGPFWVQIKRETTKFLLNQNMHSHIHYQ